MVGATKSPFFNELLTLSSLFRQLVGNLARLCQPLLVLLLTARRLVHETDLGRRKRAKSFGELPKHSDLYVMGESQR